MPVAADLGVRAVVLSGERLHETDEALAAAQEALHLADETARTIYPVERDYVRCYWLLGWANLAQRQLDTAQSHLDEALRRCRGINLVEQEPSILLALARLAVAQANPALAKTLAEVALVIAERAGYVLNLADLHNLLAQLALEKGDQATAREHAQQAKDFAPSAMARPTATRSPMMKQSGCCRRRWVGFNRKAS